MVTLPVEFVATKYPGYFWNTNEGRLYSLKTGVLKPLAGPSNNYWTHNVSAYQVSVKGRTRLLSLDQLKQLKPNTPSVIPVSTPEVPYQYQLL